MDIIEDKGNSNKNKELVDNELTLDELTSYVKSIFAEGRDRHYENKSMVGYQQCKTFKGIDRCNFLDEAYCKDESCESCQKGLIEFDNNVKEDIENRIKNDDGENKSSRA